MGANSAIIRFVSNVEWPIAICSIREHGTIASSDADAILKLLAAYAVQRGAEANQQTSAEQTTFVAFDHRQYYQRLGDGANSRYCALLMCVLLLS